MSTISAIILAHNEQQHITDCIKSVSFCDEILVIDDHSTDDTVPLATECGARVVTHALNGDWAQQRNFAISAATSDWILFVDADERISPELADEIRTVIKSESKAYWLRRYNVFRHNKATHGVVRPDTVLRLMPKEGATVEGAVHESFISPYKQSTLNGKLYHYTYDNFHQYFTKFNTYTTVAAKKYHDQGKQCSFWGDIILRPWWGFFKIYILQGGIKDGKLGFILSVYHMMYTMTKYVKLYYLNRSNGQL